MPRALARATPASPGFKAGWVCVAVYCSVLQRVALCCRVSFLASKQVLCVLQRVAVGSSALQCAAVCGSMVHSFAQCCRVFLVVLKKSV